MLVQSDNFRQLRIPVRQLDLNPEGFTDLLGNSSIYAECGDIVDADSTSFVVVDDQGDEGYMHFVCQKEPFVCADRPHAVPLIGFNKPLVWSSQYFRGFTLIELMMTLVVAVILLLVAVPGFQTFLANNRLSTQANDVIADLSFARSEAVRRGTRVTVCKSSNPTATSPTCDTNTSNPWTSGRIIFVDAGVAGTIEATAPADEILRVQQTLDGASSGNRLLGDANNGTPVRVSFSATGMAESLATLAALPGGETEAQLRLCDNRGENYGRAIVVTITGRTRVTAVGKNKTGGTLSCA